MLTNDKPSTQISNDDIKKEAIALVKTEKDQWDSGSAFITEKISYEMRNVVKRARKNYFGVFDEPNDSVTGLEKIWIPLTEWATETYVKNIDLDTKDINVRGLNSPAAEALANFVARLLKRFLDQMGFGKMLDRGQRRMAIDGTWIQKSWQGYDEEVEKQTLKTRIVDRLNFWIDPTAESCQKSTCIERALLTQEDVRGYEGKWLDTNKIVFNKDLPDLPDQVGKSGGSVPMTDAYERWGKMPEYFITGDKKDSSWVDGIIIVSGLQSGQSLCHKILRNTKGNKPYKTKPYNEARLREAPGRFDGRGIPEQLFGLQMYLNELVNTRRNNNLTFHNHIFEYRKGSGINPQMLARLVAGGAIPVEEIGKDIREIPVSDQRASSYKDEEVINTWGQKITGAYEISAGETLPASMPATSAVIQNTNSKTTYTLVQEGLGMFLTEIIKKQWFPIIFEVLNEEEILNIIGDPTELRWFDEFQIQDAINTWLLNHWNTTGFMPEEADKERQIALLKEQIKKQKGRFALLKKSLIKQTDYDIQVYVTNEEFDKSVMIQNLDKMLMAYSRFTGVNLDVDAVISEALDLMGLGGERFFKKQRVSEAPVAGGVPMANPEMGLPTQVATQAQRQFTQANV